jgi:ABC-type siderophore export system fused ATPase/permease subunit
MKNLLKISILVVATALITTSFYLNTADDFASTDGIIGTYNAKAVITYKASELTDGAVADFSVTDPNLSLTVKREANEYTILLDDNNPKTAPNPKTIHISKVKTANTGITFNVLEQNYKIDTGEAVSIQGLHRYGNNNGKSTGLYKPKNKSLMFTIAGKFPKSLDGTKEATVLMNTEIEISATKQ